jgi:hypothetical protein
MKKAFSLVLLFFGFSLAANSDYQIIDLKVPNANYLLINNKSQVCGMTTEKGHGKVFFLDPQSGLQTIEAPNIYGYDAHGYDLNINNNGFVAGGCIVRDDTKQGHSALFLWSQQQGWDEIVGAPFGYAVRILSLNDSNQIIYSLQNSKTGERRLLLWENGFSYDISDIFSSAKINNKEEFFGYDSKNGNLRLYNSREGVCENIFFFKGYCDIAALKDTGIAAGGITESCVREK